MSTWVRHQKMECDTINTCALLRHKYLEFPTETKDFHLIQRLAKPLIIHHACGVTWSRHLTIVLYHLAV